MTGGDSTSATAEEIRAYEEEHDEPHPVFEVDHRPERVSLSFSPPDPRQPEWESLTSAVTERDRDE